MNKITFLTQTRFKTKYQRGNCFPTVIACLLGLNNPEDVPQFQELYDNEDECWYCILIDFLEEKGYKLVSLENHQYDDSIYMVSGNTERNIKHVCLYKNGKLYHDPHPSGSGLISEYKYEILVKL